MGIGQLLQSLLPEKMESITTISPDAPLSAESVAETELTPAGPVDRLLKRIGRGKDLPSFSKYIIEINDKLS